MGTRTEPASAHPVAGGHTVREVDIAHLRGSLTQRREVPGERPDRDSAAQRAQQADAQAQDFTDVLQAQLAAQLSRRVAQADERQWRLRMRSGDWHFTLAGGCEV